MQPFVKPYLSTPILRKFSQKLSNLEGQVTNLVVKADLFVRSNKLLGAMLGNETRDDVALLKPFLREDLIKSTVEHCIACEKERAKRPSPATLRSWLDAQSLEEADEHRKTVVSDSFKQFKKEVALHGNQPRVMDKIYDKLESDHQMEDIRRRYYDEESKK